MLVLVLSILLESHLQLPGLVRMDTCHHRTEMNKKIYKLGRAGQESHTAALSLIGPRKKYSNSFDELDDCICTLLLVFEYIVE
jgi:hypothetical protein